MDTSKYKTKLGTVFFYVLTFLFYIFLLIIVLLVFTLTSNINLSVQKTCDLIKFINLKTHFLSKLLFRGYKKNVYVNNITDYPIININ